jgi:Protein of unknown function (DUF4058)
MPIHNWSAVNPGLFHHFHLQWISTLSTALNAGGLPPGYYALAEQRTPDWEPDVLTLQLPSSVEGNGHDDGGVAVATAPPKTRFVIQTDEDAYAAKANRITIRHHLGDVVAVIEIVSPGNKSSRTAVRSFVEKAAEFLRSKIHLLVIDLFPPSPRDPEGLHPLIWNEFHEEPFALPADKRLTLAAYSAGNTKTAYVEPVAVGDELPNMPIFLTPERYVPAPLAETYETTWSVCPQPLKDAVLKPTER